VRVGQYRSPYAREQLIGDQYQMAVNRSIVSRNYGLWYTQGAEMQFQGDDLRWNLSFDDGGNDAVLGPSISAVGSHPMNAPWYTQQTVYSVTTRLEWKPFGAWSDFNSMTSPMGDQAGLLLGVAIHSQITQPINQFIATSAANGAKNNWNSITGDIQWNFGGASIYASAYFNYLHSTGGYISASFPQSNPLLDFGYVNAYGFTFQPSIYVDPKLELYARYEYACWSTNNAANLSGGPFSQQGPLSIVTVGLNWYLDGQDLKWTNDVGVTAGFAVGPSYIDNPAGWRASGIGEFVFRSRLQLMF
jgi:hypothetical protein